MKAIVIQGHGIASGKADDARFPAGTLALQWKYFEAQGLDLANFYRGTLNLCFGKDRPPLISPLLTVRQLKWHPDCPPEDFSFFNATICYAEQSYSALVYYPHPETKPEHFQPDNVLEFLAPKIDGVQYGDRIDVESD